MIYVYEQCCGHERERICSLRAYEADPEYFCPECGRRLAQVITPPRLFARRDFEPFVSPVDGSMIHSHRELEEHNKRNNVYNLHDGYDEKAVQKFIQTDWFKDKDEERRKDLAQDMQIAVEKLENGYIPTPAPDIEECPDA